MRLDADYVLPLRWSDDTDLDDLTAYLRDLAEWVDVTVVDGSPPALFAAHARAFPRSVRHVAAPPVTHGNGKARGVVTGLVLARHEAVVIADDDVRHDRASLVTLLSGLSDADLVVPQNVFFPAPWHARWDTARSLVNRGLGRDFPGTYAVRRLALPDGYDVDVLFENLEMERTVLASGGQVRHRRDLYVRRLPPDARRFFSQRVRQAYDSSAQPARMCTELALAPAIVLLRRRPGILCLLAAVAVAIAEWGRRRAHGAAVYPRTAALWAPAWAAERALTSWLALGLRLRGGVVYAGRRVRRAATSPRVLGARVAGGRFRA